MLRRAREQHEALWRKRFGVAEAPKKEAARGCAEQRKPSLPPVVLIAVALEGGSLAARTRWRRRPGGSAEGELG